MKRNDIVIIFVSILSIFFGNVSFAQEINDVPQGYVLADSVVYRPAAVCDTTLAGKDVFLTMPSKESGNYAGVTISQSDAIAEAVRGQVVSNAARTLPGYRVRIFFDNKQSARAESEVALKRFESIYHDVVAYRTYANPYFKVTVGDFRTRSEAVKCLERIRSEFPSAFVVKESISYPVVDKENAYVVDTVKVLRPKAAAY